MTKEQMRDIGETLFAVNQSHRDGGDTDQVWDKVDYLAEEIDKLKEKIRRLKNG